MPERGGFHHEDSPRPPTHLPTHSVGILACWMVPAMVLPDHDRAEPLRYARDQTKE